MTLHRKPWQSVAANAFMGAIWVAASSKVLDGCELERYGVDIRDIITVLFLTTMKFTHRVQVSLSGILLMVCLVPGIASAQAPGLSPIAAPNLTPGQIVTELQGPNLSRAAALKHYHSVRHYAV